MISLFTFGNDMASVKDGKREMEYF